MLQLERQKLILEYLKQNRKATTNELSEMLGVSTTTIRTDLNQMDKEKLLTKTHGGALYHDNSADFIVCGVIVVECASMCFGQKFFFIHLV